MLLPATDADEAMEVAERLRTAIADRLGPHRKVTASLGVATSGPDTPDAATLVDHADRALYHSKQSGRNTITHAARIIRRPPERASLAAGSG